MSEMRAALLAEHFHALHAVADIGARHDILGSIMLPETRPAGTGIKFGLRVEQCGTAAYTAINSGIMAIPVRTAEGRFGAALAAHLVLLRCEFLAPFCVSFVHCITHKNLWTTWRAQQLYRGF